MESYWCSKKISIVNWINNRADFYPALTPCLKLNVRGGIMAGVFISEKQAFNILAFSGGLAGFFKELFPSFCNFGPEFMMAVLGKIFPRFDS